MASKLKPVNHSVVVVTGASGGIGRATAEAFAAAGAAVVLAARRADALGEVADACRRAGAPQAFAVPTDVTDPAAVEALARFAIEHLGRIDTWVNNAGVAAIGRLEDTPPDVVRRVIETNLLGTAHGLRAAIPYLREQGHGVIVNVASVAGRAGQAYFGAYCASKHGILGLSEAVRQELIDAPDVHVCTVLPGAIDTPIWQHAANHTGRSVTPPGPALPPTDVAAAIVRLATHPQREVVVGPDARAMIAAHAAAPDTFDQTSAKAAETALLHPWPTEPSTGNLFDSAGPSELTGGWPGPARSATPWVAVAAGVAGVAASAFLAGQLARRRRS